MNIIICASPGSASNSLLLRFEKIMKTKSTSFRSGGGIGHLALNVGAKYRILNKIGLNKFKRNNLIYQHFFPTKKNIKLINYYFKNIQFVITYRNIYDQINYFYKRSELYGRCPLSFHTLENKIKSNNKFKIDYNDIDLNLDLVLNFYKMWFYLIQNKKIKSYELLSFDEIVNCNSNYQEKLQRIFKKKYKQIDLKKNIHMEKKYSIIDRHYDKVKNFISDNHNIDFKLIV